jgi:hypothetical protein
MPDTDLERFVDDLVFQLRLWGHSVFRFEIQPWVQAAWPLIAEDPAVSKWATAWLKRHQPAGAE